MQLVGMKPDSKISVSILIVCVNLEALEQGMEIHDKISRNGFMFDVMGVYSLIEMYEKCGCIHK